MSINQNMRRIVCLANSRKPHGRCIAGKLYSQGNFGSWLRPISDRQGEELSDSERQYQGKIEPSILDVIEFSILSPKVSGHQVENSLVDRNRKFQKVGAVKATDLIKVVDKPVNLWIMGYQSKTYGKNDLIPEARIKEAQNSLFLINPYTFDVQVISTNYGKQIRGRFTYHGAEYNLRITDPIFEASFKGKTDGEHTIKNALLTISLAHDLHEVAGSKQSTGYYKIIAGVILLDDSKNNE